MGRVFPLDYVDYIAFLGGVALLIIATHGVALRQAGNKRFQWLWLAAFAVLRTVDQWYVALAEPFVSNPWILWLDILAAAAAFAALMEFGLSSERQRAGARRVGVRWLVAAIAVGLIPGAGLLGFGREVGNFMLLGAALFVARELVQTTRDETAKQQATTIHVAVSLVGYMGTCVAACALMRLPGDMEAFAWLVAARSAFALFLMVGLGGYALRFGQSSTVVDERYDRIARRILGLSLALMLVLGWAVTDIMGQEGERKLLDSLRAQARMAASAIAPEYGAEDAPAATRAVQSHAITIEDHLNHLLLASESLTDLRVVRLEDGRVVEVAYASVDGPDIGSISAILSGIAKEQHAVLADGNPHLLGPLEADGKTWYTAFAPIEDAGFDTTVTFVGADMDAATVDASRSLYRLLGILLSFAISSLILGLYVVVQITRTMAARVSLSERSFRTMFENAPEAILVVDAHEGLILSASPYTCTWLGREGGSLSGVPLADLAVIEPDVLAGMLRECYESAVPEPQSCHFRHAEGREIDVEAKALAYEYDGKDALIIFARDVTASVSAQQETEAHALFSQLIAETTMAFVDANEASIGELVESALTGIGTYAGVDRAYLFDFAEDGETMSNVFEWCDEGISSRKSFMRRVPVSKYSHLAGNLMNGYDVHVPDVAADTGLPGCEREALQAAGVQSLLVVPMVVVGRTVGFLGFDSIRSTKEWSLDNIMVLRIVADVIAAARRRVAAEAKVKQLSLAIEQSPVGVIITDPDGDIRYANPKFGRLTGYSTAELRGKNPRILKSGETPQEVYEDLWTTVAAGKIWRGEVINKRADESRFWAALTISPMRGIDGRITGYVGIQQDVTQVKEAQAALEEAKLSAETANRAKSDFLATMSHEIRTPMNAIIGMAELLRETELTKAQARYIDIFESAGESLLILINSILDLSKIEANRLDLDPVPFDLYDMVEGASSVVGMKAAEKGLEVLYRVKPGTPEWVVGDPDRLRQVLLNLLGNAVKFTESGHVYVAVEQDPLSDDPGALKFSVTDTGIGIAEDKLGAVFESFTQADSSTTRKYGGTGLGLTISRRLVEVMGGTIEIASRPGKGTTFTFTVKLEVAEAPMSAVNAPPDLREGARILVVDDNATNRLILRETLSTWGVLVGEASDGADGLEQVRRAAKAGETWDAIVLDYQMPRMDGFAFLEELRATSTFRDLPVIMLSSDMHSRDGERGKRLGLVDNLQKPVRRNELRQALADALGGTWERGLPGPRRSTHGVSARNRADETKLRPAKDIAPLEILVAEDSEDNRFLLESCLGATPHRVTFAENGREALDLVESGQVFDLVFMDMQMPIMDGYEAARLIRERERPLDGVHMPIVALTAYALSEEVEKCLAAGCDAHLAKPIRKKVLLEAIEGFEKEGNRWKASA
ncbi:MAG: response regulator [Actinomycetota bacterium]|nr:response regulator [Actinomycetota bacterium]